MMKPLRLLVLACIALALSSPAAARDWLRAVMPGFVVYSDGYPHDLELWALKIQLYDALLENRYGGKQSDPGSPLTIYLLPDAKAVSALVGKKNLTGTYSSSSEGSFAIASRQPEYYKDRLSGQITLFHEYAHHFMYRHFVSAYPAWYREGFAEYVSTASFDMDWRATFGAPAIYRYKTLRKDPPSIEKILTGSVDDFEPDEKARFYAWSWKLVHMLNATPARQRQLDRYLTLFANGTAPLTAATTAFGDLAQLETDLHAYVPRASGTTTATPVLQSQPEVTVEFLDAVDSRLVDLHLNRRLDRDPQRTTQALRALAAAHPDRANVLSELAMAERELALAGDAKVFPAAEAAASAALALAPNDARTAGVWADLAFRRMKSQATSKPEDWSAVRTRLAAVMARDPDDPFAEMTLFRSFLDEPKQPSIAAHSAIARAFALQPESYEIRSMQIYSLAIQGRFAQARAIARILASDPHAAAIGKQALASLDRMENRQGGPGAVIRDRPRNDAVPSNP